MVFIWFGSVRSNCLHPEVHDPCVCTDGEISCYGPEANNLKEIMRQFNDKLEGSDRHFKSFLLDNSSVTHIEDNTFFNITFDYIGFFWNRHLTHIDSHAFGQTTQVTKRVNIEYTPIGNRELFHALNTLTKIEVILCQHLNITEIPSHAFREDIEAQDSIHFLGFPAVGVTRIGDYAFYELNNLEELDLDHNTIGYIPENAFAFSRSSNKTLQINLTGMEALNSTGFALGSLSNIKRPTVLNLKLNENITYLDEKIFRPFFDAHDLNRVLLTDNFGGIGIDCNHCANYWLLKESRYLNMTDITSCANGLLFRDERNFSKCKQIERFRRKTVKNYS